MSKFQLLSILLMLCIASLKAQPDAASSTTTPATTSLKVSSITGYTVGSARDTLSKRGVQVADLTQSAATGKSYDPPPEFYRGPGSTSGSASGSNYNNRDNQVAGINVKPIAFPDTNERNNYAQDTNNYLSTTFSNWKQQLKGGYGGVGSNGRPPVQDRISVGHYGSSDHGGGGGGGSAIGYNYGYEGRPYATAPGGSGGGGGGGGGGHQLDYNPHAAHYGASALGGGYGAGDHHTGNNLYYNSDESIPFDLYNNNNNYNKGQYAGAGGEYSYTQYSANEQEHAAHKGHPDLPQKSLLVKSFLIPLASAAVLGIAAALVSNPLLLQLGTVSGVAPALVGKRKRRSANVARLTSSVAEQESLQQRKALWLAYRGQHGQNQELS